MKLLIGFLLLKVTYCIMKRPQIKLMNRIIDVDSSIQKVENDTLQLNCFADYPIKWVLPDNEVCQNTFDEFKSENAFLFASFSYMQITVTRVMMVA